VTDGSSTVSIGSRVWVSELGGSLDVESGTLQLADGLSSGVGTSNEAITVNGTGFINSTTTINVGYDGDNNSLSATSGGSVIAPSIWIGGQAGADNNSVTASGTGTNLVSTSSTVVGYAGSNNTLTISSGATSGGTAAHIYIGYESTANNNTAIVTGANSTWSTTGAFIVGNNGTTNSLAVEDGGQVLTTSQDIQIGFNAGSNNNALTVNGTGSLVSNNATLYVGNNGNNNSLSVTNGGNLTTFNTRIGGGAASNNNTLTISDAGSVWNNAGTLRVGSSGSGNALNIANGANATIVGNMFLGYSSGSVNNTVTVNGTDSVLTAGNLTVGRQGSGTLAVNNGGKVIILGGIEKGNASTVAIGQGGTLQLGNGGAGGLLGISALQSNGTIIVNSSSSYSYNGSVSGSGNFIKEGTGTLTVAGNNTYSGGTAVNGGILALGATNLLLNTGNLSVDGGSFDVGAFQQTLKNVTLSSGSINGTGGTITAQTYAVESGLVSANLAGNASLTKSTAGTVTLSGSNTYNGTTSINAGTLELGSAGGLGAGGNITFGGGILQYGSGITTDLSSRIKNSNSTIAIDTGGNTVSYSSSINSTNTGGLTKLGNGTLSLNGNSTYTGGTFIESGTLAGNSLGVKGNISNNATLQLASGSYVIEVSGSGALLVSESSNSVLLGNATMSGGTNIQSGFLTIGGRNSAQIFILGSIDGNIANEGALRFDMNTGNRTYSGVISGNGSLSSTSSGYGTSDGTLYLTGNNTFTGGTTWSHGTLDISGGSLAATGNVTITGGSFDIGASNQTIGNFKINGLQTTAAIGSGSLTASSYDLQQGAVSLALSGTADLDKNTIGYGLDSYQNGVVHLSGNNTATGNITISSGILSFNTVQSLYSGNNASWTPAKITVSSNATSPFTSTLALGTGNGSATSGFNNTQIGEIFANLTQNGTGGLTANSSIGFNVAIGNFTLTTAITDRPDGGVLGLDKIGSGALVLGAQNSFTGPMNIYEGIVRAGIDDALSTNSSLVVTTRDSNRVASYDLGDFNQQFLNVTLLSGTLNGGNGTINATGNYTMVSGDSYANLGGVAPLLKTGNGIVYLYGNSTYTGHTTINGTTWSGQFVSAPTSSSERLQFQNPGSLYTDNASRWNGGNITVNQYGIFSVRADASGVSGFTENRIATLITNLISANRTSGGLLGGSAFGIDTAGTNMTLSTAFTDSTGRVAGGGAIGFVKYGNGTLTLNGTNNTHSLVTTVTGGTLALAPGTILSASSANLSVQNAALDLGTTNQTVGSVFVLSGSILGSGTLTATAGDSDGMGFSFLTSNITANLAGAFGANIGNYAGPTILWGNNTHGGNTTVRSSATLSLANRDAVAASTLVADQSSSIQFSVAGANTYNLGGLGGVGSIAIGNNTLSIGANNQNTSYGSATGSLSGTGGSIVKVGNGTLTFAGNNTYTGSTTISAGTLALGSGGTSGSVTGNITNNADLVFNRSGNYTFADVVSGAGNVTQAGTGVLTLSGNNTYTGNTTVNSGTLSLNGSLASSTVSIASGAGLNTSGGLSQNSAVANAGNFTVNAAETIGSLSGSGNTILNAALTTGALGNPGNPDQISGIISGNGAITFNSIPSANKASALTANNTYTGSTTVSNSTLILSGNGSIASSSFLTLGANATLNINSVTAGSSTVNNLSSLDTTAFIELGSKTLIDIATDNRTFSGTIGSANPGGFTKRGNGTLTLAGYNDYFGATSIEAGVLFVTGSLFGTSPWSAPTAVSVSSGATYKLGSNDTVASIAGAGSINLDSYALTLGVNSTTANTTFSGVVSGANGGRLIKAGTGTLTLGGNNTYTGGTTISAGTLAVANNRSITHAAANTVIGANSGDNGTLTINGGSVTNAQGIIGRDAGSTGVVEFSSGNWTNTELRIGNSGNGTLNLTGGTLSNSGNYTAIGHGNGSTGVANVSGGNWTNASELQVGSSGNGTLNITGGTVTNVAGFVATFDGSTGVVNVSGGNWTNTDRLRLGRLGNGTLNLTGGNVIIGSGGTGNLTVAVNSNSTGTLNIGNGTTAGTLQAARVTAGNGTAIVNFNHTGNLSFSPIMEGNLTVNKLGAGTTTLTGNNTYTGGTFVNSGTLQGNTQNLQGAITNNASLVFNQTANGTYSGAMSGNGALSKIGNGTLTVSGNSSSYTGTAAINAGTVALTGNLANSSMDINNGATLTGNGTAGAVTINSGGTIAPGTSPGTLTTGNMTWNGGGTYAWELASANGTAGTGWDLISSNGSLTIGANATNKFTIAASTTNASGFNPNARVTTWKIADFAGGITGFSADAFSINATGFENLPAIYGFGVSTNGTALNFSYATIATWIGGSGNWTTASNWQDAFAPVTGVEVEYAGTNGTSTNDSTVGAIGALTFSNNATGSFTLAGGGLTIGTGGIVNNSSSTQTVALNLTLGANQTFAANTANLLVSGNITGNASLTKSGNKTLTLAGSNTYLGETQIDAGTLAIAAGASLNGTSKILVGNSTSGNTMTVLGTVATGNLTLSEQVGSDDNTLTVGGGSSAASLTVGNLINVGFGGEGNSLQILGNGTVTAASTWVGGYGSNNTLEVAGGVLNSTSSLIVGYFSNANTANITSGGNATVGSVTVGLDAASSNNTILVSGTGSALNTAGLIYLGENGTSNSIVVENGGKVVSQALDAVIGLNAGSNANALTVNGTGSQFTNNGTLYVGKFGSENTLSVLGGGALVTKNSRIGHEANSSNNTATVSGNGSTWTNAGTLRVGNIGANNALTIADGGAAQVTGNLFVGHGANSSNNQLAVQGVGSKLFGSNLTVGHDGSSNTLSITSGGNATLSGGLAIGYNAASSNNTALVSGNGSVLSAQNIQIGAGADNKLVVADSGLVTTANIALAGTNATLQIGDGAAAGNLSLTGSILTTVTASGLSVVFNHTDSAYEFASLMSGDLAVSLIGSGNTILTANSTYTGGTTISAGTLSIGNGGASGSITGNITNNSALVFNRSDATSYSGPISGTGILEKLGAGTLTLTGNNSYSGGTTVSFGTLAVASGGSISHAAADTVIGDNSGNNGTLVIDGGTVSNNNGFIGKDAGSVGVVTMNSGVWTNQSNLSIGQSGNGTLNLNGGNLSSAGGDIGYTEGQVNVSGGSWTNSADLYVGNGGSGSLTISGGDVSNGAAYVGFSPGGIGSVSISNGTWTNSATLMIGGSGSGNLVITGGNVSNTLARLGSSGSGSGSARISGGTWSNSSGLMIGIGGDGDLTLTGGTVIANGGAGNLTLALGLTSTGTLNIGNGTSAGTLQAARVTGGNGIAIVNFNHNGSHAFSSNLEGSLTVNLLGTGTTTLSGNNTYTGGTFVNAGILEGDSQSLQGAISNNASVVFNQTANGTYAGIMSGNGTLSKIGSESLTLSGNNTFTGGTTVDAGTLVASGIVGDVTNSANFVVETGGAAGAVTNLATGSNNGTVASLSNLGTFTSSGNITGDVMSFNGLVTIGQSGRVSGNTTIAGGELVVAGAVSNVSNNAILRVETGGTAGAITNLGNGLATNNGTVASLLTSGNFTNTGNITGGVTSFGTLESSGAIGGSLIVGGGMTTINGTVAGATTVTAGILAGTGTVGDVVINSGGAIAPGNSPGTITTGNMTWNGGGIYNWELASVSGTAGTDWDLISSTGSLTINATTGDKFVINAANDSGSGFALGATSYKWQLANFSGNITGFSTDKFTINAIGFNGTSGIGAFSVSANSTALSLNYRTLFVWDAGNGTWSTDTNWLDNALPVNGAPIEFAGLGGNSTNNNYLTSISGLTFTANAGEVYTLAGGNLSIGAGGIVNNSAYEQTLGLNITLGSNQTFAANTANLVVSGNISGAASLTKEGSQTLVLAGANTYTGGTTVNAGGLIVEGAVGDISNNATLTVQTGGFAGGVTNLVGATGTNNGTVASLANAGNFSNSGNITGGVTSTGTLTSNGRIGGTLGVNGGLATIGAGGQVVGTSTITSGTLNVSGTVAGVSNNATLTIQQGGAAGSVSNLVGATGTNNGTVASLANAGTFANSGNITGNATTSGTLMSNGRIGGNLGVNGGLATIGAAGQVVGSSTITSGTLDVSGSVAGVNNNATLTIQESGAAGSVNNLAGATGTNNGTVASLANLGAFTNSGNITGNATTNGTLSSTGTIGGTLAVDGGTATIGVGGQVVGATTVNAGTIEVSGTVAGVSNNATFTIQTGGVSGAVTNSFGATATNNGTVASLINLGTFTNSGNITGDVMSFNGLVTIGQSGRVTGNTTIGGGEFVISGSVANVTNNDVLTIEQGGTAGDVTNLDGGFGTNNGTIASLLNSGSLFYNDGNITGSVINLGYLESNGQIGGALTIGGGVTTIAGTVAGTTSVVAGILQGNGTLGDVEILSGGTVAPSTPETIGTLTVGNLTLNGGGIYNWQTLSLNGNGTAGTDWDLITSNSSLTINATANSTVGIRVSSLSGNISDDIKKAQWEIGNFDGGITGYNKSFFSVNSTGLGARGRFFVTALDDSLLLNYKTAAVWLGGTGNWTTLSEWEDNFRPEDGDAVEFSGVGGTSTNNYASGNLSEISGMVFTSNATGSYTVNGNTLWIGEDGILNNSAFQHTIALNLTGGDVLGVNTATNNLTISGVISGNSALAKTGNKTLTLTGDNTYSGGTTVSAGTLAGTTHGLKGLITNNAVVNFDQSFDGTYAGVMSGTGSLVKTGSGVVTLSGNNTYTGGTTINSGVFAAALVSGNLVTLNPNALGAGSVNINSGGAMLVPSTTVNGTHLALGGDLTLNNGTIAFYDIGTSPAGEDLRINVSGNFTNAGNGVVFDFSQVEALDSGNYTLVSYNGTNFATSAISSRAGVGTTLQGSFSFNGSSLVYTVIGAESSGSDIQNNGGPNTPIVANYNVSGPTITIGINNTVAALTFNSGGSLNIQQNGVLNVSQGTLNVQSGSSVVGGGTLVAPAGLNKDGTGELDFTNNVVVTGTAAVNAGLLSVNGQLSATGGVVVNPSAILGGAGIVFANVDVKGGNLSPGNSPGTLTVVGNLVLTGANSTTIEIESPTNYDRIVVSGEAALGGTLNAVAYGGGTITPGARYNFLQAGSIVGEFDSIVAPEGLRARFLSSGTVGTLLFGPGSYVPMAINQNQRNVAKALDTFVVATNGDRLAVSIAVDSLTTAQFPAAFDQIMPGFYESLADIAIEQAFNQTQMLNQRISSVRLGAAGFQAIGGITQPLVHDKNGKSAAEAKEANPIVESATATNWNAWALGTGMFSRTTNLGSLQNYNNDAGGFLVGSDYRWSENFVTGLYGGYDYSYAEYNGGGSTKGNSFSFGTYASYAKDGYYADAVIGGGYTGFQTKRSIEFNTIDRTASADPGSGQFTAGLNLGKDFEVGKFTLGPIAGAQYNYAGIGSFTESGAESLDLSLGQQNANSLRTTLGGRIAYTWNLNQKIALIPEVRMFWQHEFLNNPRTINASLDGGSGASFGYETTDPYRNSVFAGAGVTAQFGKNLTGSVFYNINFGSQTYQNNMVSAGLNISF
jgi:autotransporter-associated beta strand protein/T5SS/PEP-CTERM-associated repeat protein